MEDNNRTYPEEHKKEPGKKIPYGVEMNSSSQDLEIILRWDNVVGTPMFRFMTFFSLFWNAMVSLFVVVIILVGEWQVLLFLSIFIFVGVGLIYYQITQLWNRTRITVEKGLLKIHHGPLPVFKGNRTFKTTDIRQMYVAEYEFGSVNGVPQMACRLMLVPKEGSEIILINGQEREPLRFMERQIEHFLGIRNQAMAGEMPD